MRLRRSIFSYLFVATIALGVSVFSPSHAEARRDGEKRWEKIAKELNLSAEQKEKLNKVRGDFKQTMPEKRKAMKAAREEMQKAIHGDASDDEVKKKFADLQSKQDEFAKSRIDKILAIRAILTPEQRTKFHEFESKHPRKWKHRDHDEDGDD